MSLRDAVIFLGIQCLVVGGALGIRDLSRWLDRRRQQRRYQAYLDALNARGDSMSGSARQRQNEDA